MKLASAIINIVFQAPVLRWSLYSLTALSSGLLLLKARLKKLRVKESFLYLAGLIYTICAVCVCVLLFMFVSRTVSVQEEEL